MECLFFYLVSLTTTPQIRTVIQIEQDSVYYYNGSKYVKEAIIHQRSDIYVTSNGYITRTGNNKVIIGRMGKYKPITYTIKRQSDKCY